MAGKFDQARRSPARWLLAGLIAALCGLLITGAVVLSDVKDNAAPLGRFGVLEPQVVLAAGDIADCATRGADRVASLLDGYKGMVLTLGDHAYPSGRAAEFRRCYDPTWGRHRERTKPVPGNHDYMTDGAAPYFDYFGSAAGDPERGYYSFDLGPYWHVIAMNTNCDEVPGGCGEHSPQADWLREQLAANADRNVLAYWHHARFSTGAHGDSSHPETFFRLLHEAEADLVLAAHDHSYERFAPLDPEGDHDPAGGIRQFVVGTGGGDLDPFPFYSPPALVTDVRNDQSHGVLRLELGRRGYSWRFLPAEGDTFTDEGSWPVNGPPPRPRRDGQSVGKATPNVG